MTVRRLDTSAPGFAAAFDSLVSVGTELDSTVDQTVKSILSDIRTRGDAALLELTCQLDRRAVATVDELRLDDTAIQGALARTENSLRTALEQAAERIRAYHAHQLARSWSYQEDDGTLLGQHITALDRVGIYVPGGKASYPSSVLMNAIPARVAGVNELVMTVPAPGGVLSDVVVAAAAIAGVDHLFTIGGAQAIGALAFGTVSVPRVDKIVGPGNAYVAAAKRAVFGVVGIDMVAGPSEILIVCDGSVPVEWVAMDLFSQAEHDEMARAILLCPDTDFIDAVAGEIDRLLPHMARRDIIAASLSAHGALIRVRDLDEAVELSNRIAPEHLELSVADPDALLPGVRHAGAIFMGRYSAEVLGDYCAGPNHVLPTAGTARFSSPLGVYDFQKRSSLIRCSARGASTLGVIAAELAYGEGLEAHAKSAELRIDAG